MDIKAKKVKLIVLDVDGTMTDGKIYLDNSGNETKAFNVKDGFSIASAINLGVEVVIITGRESNVVKIRAKELGIKEVHQKIKNKIEKLDEIIRKYELNYEEIGYIGDDINDLPAMQKVGYKGAPSDAVAEVKSIADFISYAKGGEGAVREFIECILKSQGLWQKVMQKYQFDMPNQ